MTYIDPIKKKFNAAAYKHAIGMVESSGGKFLETGVDPATGKSWSSASGKYHFLYELIKKDPEMKNISKRQFINNPKLQERIMDKALAGNLKGYTYGSGYANKIIKEFNSDKSVNEVSALVHFLGAGNARKYLKDPAGFRVPGKKNMTGDQYLGNFNKYFSDHEKKNPVEGNAPKVDSENKLEAIDRLSPPSSPKLGIPDERSQGLRMIDNTDAKIQQPKDIIRLTDQSHNSGLKVIGNDSNSFEGGGSLGTGEGAKGLVTLFENGGSHDQNPNGGIPQGVGLNGKQNLVEEGETKWSDYIFSNAINLDGIMENEDGSSVNVFEDGGDLTDPKKKKKPIVVHDRNDPRLKSYQDSLSLYKNNDKIKDWMSDDPDKIANNFRNKNGSKENSITDWTNRDGDSIGGINPVDKIDYDIDKIPYTKHSTNTLLSLIGGVIGSEDLGDSKEPGTEKFNKTLTLDQFKDPLQPYIYKPRTKTKVAPKKRDKVKSNSSVKPSGVNVKNEKVNPSKVTLKEPKYWDVEIEVNMNSGSSKTKKRVHSKKELDVLKRKHAVDMKSKNGKNNKLNIKGIYK